MLGGGLPDTSHLNRYRGYQITLELTEGSPDFPSFLKKCLDSPRGWGVYTLVVLLILLVINFLLKIIFCHEIQNFIPLKVLTQFRTSQKNDFCQAILTCSKVVF